MPDLDAGASGARRALPGEGTGMSGVVGLAEQLAVAVKALRAARQFILDNNPQDDAGFYDDAVQVALDQIDDALRGAV